MDSEAGHVAGLEEQTRVAGDIDMAKPDDQVNDDLEMDDLFGNMAEMAPPSKAATVVDHNTSPDQSGEGSDRVSTPEHERERRKALEYEEEEEPGGVLLQVKEAIVQIPNIPVPTSSNGKNWVVRMPNFVKVDSKPFHPDTYVGPEHDDEELQQGESIREKSMTIKLKVENTLRWRWIKDEMGNDQKQSNSRIIRWSDGSLSLRLGKELFDIKQSVDTSGANPRTPLASQPQSQSEISPAQSQSLGAKSQGLTYLVAQHKHSEVLQSEALVTGYMTLTPTGMQSETHRMLVRAVGQKHNKIARLRMAPDPITDPEREKMELLKQSAKKSKRKTDLDDGLGGGRRKRTGYTRKRGADVWSDDGDEERHDLGTDDEDEDGMGSTKAVFAKKKPDDRQGAGEYQHDEFLVADSSDEDAGSDGKQKQKEIVTEEDPLDRLDAQIQEQEDEKSRQQKRSAGTSGETEQAQQEMDVESEEDEEEEFKIRRAGGTGGRKKRAIDFDNDEDD